VTIAGASAPSAFCHVHLTIAGSSAPSRAGSSAQPRSMSLGSLCLQCRYVLHVWPMPRLWASQVAGTNAVVTIFAAPPFLLFNRRRAECNLACTHFARLGLLVGQREGTAQRSTCYMVGFSGSPGPTAVVPTQDCGIPPRRTLAIPPLTTSLAKNGLDGTWAGLRPAPPASSWR
jgi:hypothetical protein